MKAVLPEADIGGHEKHIAGIDLPDADDRHVLAAAIAAGATTILTWNLGHFPASATAPFGVAARDPDTFLTELASDDPERIAAIVDAARANLRVTAPTADEYLLALERQGLKRFAGQIRATGSNAQ